MALLTDAELLDYIDTLAQAYTDRAVEAGDGTVTLKSSKALANLQATVLAYGDVQKEVDLLPSVRNAKTAALGAAVQAGKDLVAMQALDVHLGGIVAALTARALRATPNFRDAYLAATGVKMAAVTVLSPVVDPIADFDVTGSGTGTFIHGTAIDTTQYAAAHLQLKVVDNATGAALGTYHLTCVKQDGTTTVVDVAVAGLTPQNTLFDVGLVTDRFTDVTLITITGGQNNDDVKVLSVLERSSTGKDV